MGFPLLTNLPNQRGKEEVGVVGHRWGVVRRRQGGGSGSDGVLVHRDYRQNKALERGKGEWWHSGQQKEKTLAAGDVVAGKGRRRSGGTK